MTPIVFLHGFASSPQSKKAQHFGRQLEGLGYSFEVPRLDGGDFEHLTLSGQLRIVENVVAGRAVTLIGSSMGGYLAALYASRHPEVERLILLAPAFGFLRRWPRLLGEETMREWREQGERQVFHYGEGCERALRYDIITDGEQYPDTPDFDQPALIFHGFRDDVVPCEGSIEFAATHLHATLALMDAGHELTEVLPRMWERSRQFLSPA